MRLASRRLEQRLDSLVEQINTMHDDFTRRIAVDQIQMKALQNEVQHVRAGARHTEERLSTDIDSHMRTMAELHQIIADMETKLINASRARMTDLRQCNCCFSARGSAHCTQGHSICAECIDTECRYRRHDDRALVDYSIPCLACDCEGQIGSDALRSTEYGKLLLADYEIQRHMPFFLKNAHLSSTELALIRSDDTFMGYACPRCGYGPMLLANCSDLQTHQGEEVDENTYVNNKCPRCDTFTRSSSEMRRWTGNTNSSSA